MRRPAFFDHDDLLLDDVAELVDGLSAEVLARFGRFCTPGAVSGLTLSSASPLTVTAALGRALMPDGELIDPPEAMDLAVLPGDAGKLVVVARAEGAASELRAHPVTGAYKRTEGPADVGQLAARRAALAGDVVLGTISAIDDDGAVTLTTTGRQTAGLQVGRHRLSINAMPLASDVRQHLLAVGTQPVTTANAHGQTPLDIGIRPDDSMIQHQRRSHAHHLRTTDRGSRAGLMSFSGTTVNVFGLADGEEWVVNGARVDAPAASLAITLSVDGGLFLLMLTDTGTLVTSPFARYTAARTVTGVQMVTFDPSPDFPGTPAKFLVHTFDGTYHYLQWDGGPLVRLELPDAQSLGDRFYVLYGGLEPSAMTVWVDYSALPGGTETDTIEMQGYPEDDNDLILGSVFFFPSGGATGPMGYGDDGVGGRGYDLRPFGSIRRDHLADDLAAEIKQLVAGMRRDGWALGGDLSSAGLDVTLAAGVVWVDGERVIVPNQTVTVADDDDSWVWLDDAGAIQAGITDPAAAGARYVRGWRVTTAGSAVVHSVDERNVLPDVDRLLRLGCEDLHSAVAQQTPRLQVDHGPYGSARNAYRGRTLLCDAPGPKGYESVRIYLTHWSYTPFSVWAAEASDQIARVIGIEIAVNCAWLPPDPTMTVGTGACWRADRADADAVVVGIDSTGFYQSLKRREDLDLLGPTWADSQVFVNLPGWSVSPLQIDAATSSLTQHATRQQAGTDVDIIERLDADAAIQCATLPGNAFRAHGVLDVYSVAIGTDKVDTKAHLLSGCNVGAPVYAGDETSNVWKIPLRSRLMRKRHPKYGTVVRGAVCHSNVADLPGAPTDDILRPKVRLEDDGKATYLLVQGPLIQPAGSVPAKKRSFTLAFTVVGLQMDEPLPAADAIKGPGDSLVQGSPGLKDGYGRDRVPVFYVPPFYDSSGGVISFPEPGGGVVSFPGSGPPPAGGTASLPGPGGGTASLPGPGGGTVSLPTGSSLPAGQDDNSGDSSVPGPNGKRTGGTRGG